MYDLLKRISGFLKIIPIVLCIFTFQLQAQQKYAKTSGKKTITGKVVTKEGEEIIMANLIEEGTDNGTVTDYKGNFSFQVKENANIVVSYLGYEKKKINTSGKNFFNIVLEEDARILNEMVVIGYGSTRKSEFTGAANTIDMTSMLKTPMVSFTEGLAGRAAGVQVSTSDGQPGTQSDIIIRGASSMTQSNQPLYVIDGIPIDNFDQTSLNPNDIESLTILKDASSTSIYGSRGTNGVIMVTTKRGKEGKSIITLNSSVGFQSVANKMEVMSPYEFVKYQYERNPSFTNNYYLYDGKTIEDYREIPKVDFQDYLFRKAIVNNHSVSMRGGSESTKYNASLSVYNQDGIIINSGYNRYQGRISLDQKVNSKLNVGLLVNYSDIVSSGAPVSTGSMGDGNLTLTNYLFITAWGYRPVAGKDNTDFINEDVDPLYADMRVNPITSTKNEYRMNKSNNFMGNVYANYEIIKNLKLNIRGSISRNTGKSENFFNSKTTRGRIYSLNINGINASVANFETTILSNENTLNYKFSINSSHNFDLLAGYSMQTVTGMRYGFTSVFIPSEELVMSGIDLGIIKDPVANPTDNSGVSYFGRLNYNFKSRYMISSTLRSDGSSKFAKENRWGYFPSASFAWNLSEEEFMLPTYPYLSFAKFRVSYGITGNNRVSDFAYMPGLAVSSFNPAYSFENSTPSPGMYQTSLGNRKLQWESSPQTDFGLELGFFKNRIRITVDLYEKLTKRLLMNVNMPSNAPVGRIYMNSGEIQNRGWEFELKTANVQSKNFTWITDLNISQNKNKILSLADDQTILYSDVSFNSQYNMPAYVSKVGEAMGQFWGAVHDGNYQITDFDWKNKSTGEIAEPSIINSSNINDYKSTLKAGFPTNGSSVLRSGIKPGDIKYKDFDGDGQITSEDRRVIGSPFPKFIGGCSNDFRYKNIDLNVFFQWSYGNQVMNANRYILEGNSTQLDGMNQFASYVDRWTPNNATNKNFRTGGQGQLLYSSRVIEDASFLRLKALALGYSMPQQLIKPLSVEQLRLSVSANNLITWTKYTGLDPEVSTRNSSILTQGFDFSAYPRNWVITFSLNITI